MAVIFIACCLASCTPDICVRKPFTKLNLLRKSARQLVDKRTDCDASLPPVATAPACPAIAAQVRAFQAKLLIVVITDTLHQHVGHLKQLMPTTQLQHLLACLGRSCGLQGLHCGFGVCRGQSS